MTTFHLHDQDGHIDDAELRARSPADALRIYAGLSRAEAETIYEAPFGVIVTDRDGVSVTLDYGSD